MSYIMRKIHSFLVLLSLSLCILGCHFSTPTPQAGNTTTDSVFDCLDHKNVWSAKYPFEGYTYRAYLAFDQDGTFHFVIGDGGEVWGAYMGFYTVEQPNTLQIEIFIGTDQFSGTYEFDPSAYTLTLRSETGFMGEQGDVFSLEKDDLMTLDHIHMLTANFNNQDESYGHDGLPNYVPYTFSVLGESFSGYRNQHGGYFQDITNKSFVDTFLLNRVPGVSYYWCDKTAVAVKDDIIVALSYEPAENSRFGTWNTTPSVRDVINAENLPELFYVTPEMLYEVGTPFMFSVWVGNNGYIGIQAIGSPDIEQIYQNSAHHVVIFSDKEYCAMCK